MPPGADQDVRDQPGDGALAVGPRDRDDRDPPVGVADPRRRRRAGPRRSARSSDRAAGSCAPVRCACRAGETSRSASASAASAMTCARSAPRHGNVTIQWPGIRRAVDAQAAGPLAVVGAQAAEPGRERHDAVRPLARRDRRPEPDEGVALGVALAVPGPPPADGDLELDHRLQPVDVRSLEQAGLDQSHGPGRIATRLGAMDAPTALPDTRDRSTRCAPPSTPTFRPTSPTSSASSTSTAGATRRRASTRSAAGPRPSSRARRPRRAPAGSRRAGSATPW